MELREVITADDVVRAGACREGVAEFMESHDLLVTVIPVAAALAMCETEDERDHIKRAAGMDGNGYGNGYGYGDGNGYGDGY